MRERDRHLFFFVRHHEEIGEIKVEITLRSECYIPDVNNDPSPEGTLRI